MSPEILITNMKQASAMAKALGENRTLLLRGHGFVGAAKSAINMIRLCKALLINAQMLLDAMRIGGPIKEISPGEIALRDKEVGQERSYASFRGFEYEARMAGLDDLLAERVELAKKLGM